MKRGGGKKQTAPQDLSVDMKIAQSQFDGESGQTLHRHIYT